MDKTMLASGMTDGQIDDLANKLRDAARKHRDEVEKDPAQKALRSDNIGMVLFAAFRKLVEAVSNMFTRTAPVDRSRTPEQLIEATGRKQYVNADAVRTMPRGNGDKATTTFFKLDLSERDGIISDDDLEKEFTIRGLVPEFPDNLAAINEADSAFADNHPNSTHWKDADGNWCYAAFDRWDGRRSVRVDRSDDGWNDRWWFAGRPQ